jgi:hypothetical protein
MNLWNPVYLQQQRLIFPKTFGLEKLTQDQGTVRTGKVFTVYYWWGTGLLNSNQTKTSVMKDEFSVVRIKASTCWRSNRKQEFSFLQTNCWMFGYIFLVWVVRLMGCSVLSTLDWTVSLETTRLVKFLIQLRFFTSCQWYHCNCAMSNGMMQIIVCPDLYTTLNHPQFCVFRGLTEWETAQLLNEGKTCKISWKLESWSMKCQNVVSSLTKCSPNLHKLSQVTNHRDLMKLVSILISHQSCAVNIWYVHIWCLRALMLKRHAMWVSCSQIWLSFDLCESGKKQKTKSS